jgi:hypothetical protein
MIVRAVDCINGHRSLLALGSTEPQLGIDTTRHAQPAQPMPSMSLMIRSDAVSSTGVALKETVCN